VLCPVGSLSLRYRNALAGITVVPSAKRADGYRPGPRVAGPVPDQGDEAGAAPARKRPLPAHLAAVARTGAAPIHTRAK